MNVSSKREKKKEKGKPCFAWVNVNIVKGERLRVRVALHLKSLAWHGLACRDAFKSGSAWAALLGWLVWGERARCHGTVDDRWRRGHAVGSGGRRTVLRWRATRLDGHLRETCAWDNTLLAAVHLGAESLDIVLVCVLA